MDKVIFLDRDGTINIEKNYLHRIEDFEFIPGVIDGLRILQDAGYSLIIITNQSGIARGYYSEQEFHELTKWMLNELDKNDVHITDVFFCPHLPNAEVVKYRKICSCRKPLVGLFEKAVKKYSIDLASSFAIGDRIRDISICKNTMCRGFLVGESEDRNVIEAVKTGKYERVLYANNILECSKIIIG